MIHEIPGATHRRVAAVTSALLLCVAQPPPAAARPLFAAPRLSYPVGDAPVGVAQGDFDLDGQVDLATCNFAANTLTIWFGAGDGRFGRPATLATLAGPSSILAVGQSARGPDLFVTNFLDGGVSLFRNDGSGRFTQRIELEGEPGSVQAAWGDVTLDGRPDLVVANYTAGAVTVYDSNTGFLSRTNHAAGPGPIGVQVGDLNGDGLNDAVVTNYSAGTLSLLPGDPAGLFRPRVPYEVMPSPLAALGADLDGDGRMDVVVPGSETDVILVLRSLPGFEFDRRDSYAVGSRPAAVIAADLDGDRVQDLVVAQSNARGLAVFKGTGDARFRAAAHAQTGPGPIALVASDFNADGHVDLAATANGVDELSVLLGNGDLQFGTRIHHPTSAPPLLVATADLDGDGLLDLIDVTASPFSLEVRRATGPTTFDDAQGSTGWPGGTPPTPVGIAVGVLVPGGKPRIVVAGAGQDALHIFAAGGFASGPVLTASLPLGTTQEITSVALADLNGDGRVDLAATLAASGRVAICLGAAGVGSGFSPPRYVVVGPGASGLASGDFDADGFEDLVATARGSRRLTLLSGGAGEPPLTPRDFESGLNLSAPVVDDFNRDGRLDVAAVDSDLGELRVFLAEGSGGWVTPVAYGCGQGATGLILADLNADGRRDPISVSPLAGTVTTWFVTAEGNLRDRQDFGAGSRPVGVAAGSASLPARSHLFVADREAVRITLLENGGILTPVALLDFGARREGDAVVVRWRVGEEGRKRSYRLYRSVGEEAEQPAMVGWRSGDEAFVVRDPAPRNGSDLSYRLAERAADGTVRWFGPLHVEAVTFAAAARLAPPAPNPFRAWTRLEYTLSAAGRARLVIHDVEGRLVRTLTDRHEAAGVHALEWDGVSDAGFTVGAGVYLLRLESAGGGVLRKLVRLP